MSTLLDQSKNSKLCLTNKQRDAVDFIGGGDHTLLVADTGEGKTAICLHAIKQYILNKTITQAIVACPASVVSHWPVEADKWGTGLDVKALKGDAVQRHFIAQQRPDVLVVSLNNLEWLLCLDLPDVGMVVVDELSKAAGKQTKKLRTKKWKEQIKIRVGMTATPVSENFEKLFAMARVIDNGAALGRTKDGFMDKYFIPEDYKGYKHSLRPNADAEIMATLEPMLYNINSDKHKTLPPVVEHRLMFDMPLATREAYNEMRKHMLIELAGGDAVAVNQAVVSGKLRQIASGFIINELDEVQVFDNRRAIEVLNWALKLKGEAGLILYQFNHQLLQLRGVLHALSVAYIFGGSDKEAALAQFKAGEVQLLVAQELTVSHGVDGLQHVCSSLLFMAEPWSADVRIQAIGRLHRNGQKNPTFVSTLMCRNTVDDLVDARHEDKAENMKLFLAHLKD